MIHNKNCAWRLADCKYKSTHHYCPHPEHACTCDAGVKTIGKSKMVHLQNGFFFELQIDGSVRIIKTHDGLAIRKDKVAMDFIVDRENFDRGVEAMIDKT